MNKLSISLFLSAFFFYSSSALFAVKNRNIQSVNQEFTQDYTPNTLEKLFSYADYATAQYKILQLLHTAKKVTLEISKLPTTIPSKYYNFAPSKELAQNLYAVDRFTISVPARMQGLTDNSSLYQMVPTYRDGNGNVQYSKIPVTENNYYAGCSFYTEYKFEHADPKINTLVKQVVDDYNSIWGYGFAVFLIAALGSGLTYEKIQRTSNNLYAKIGVVVAGIASFLLWEKYYYYTTAKTYKKILRALEKVPRMSVQEQFLLFVHEIMKARPYILEFDEQDNLAEHSARDLQLLAQEYFDITLTAEQLTKTYLKSCSNHC